jgi:hypothetical protein
MKMENESERMLNEKLLEDTTEATIFPKRHIFFSPRTVYYRNSKLRTDGIRTYLFTKDKDGRITQYLIFCIDFVSIRIISVTLVSSVANVVKTHRLYCPHLALFVYSGPGLIVRAFFCVVAILNSIQMVGAINFDKISDALRAHSPQDKILKYGTAGFRDKAALPLHSVFVKMGILVSTVKTKLNITDNTQPAISFV